MSPSITGEPERLPSVFVFPDEHGDPVIALVQQV